MENTCGIWDNYFKVKKYKNISALGWTPLSQPSVLIVHLYELSIVTVSELKKSFQSIHRTAKFLTTVKNFLEASPYNIFSKKQIWTF